MPLVIVVYGTVCLDRLRTVAALPPLGGYQEILSESLALGGEAANTCAALRSWGDEALLVGNSLGTGPEAELLQSLLAGTGLADTLAPAGAHACPYCDIYVTPDGDRTMFGLGFAEMKDRHGLALIPWDKASWIAFDDNHSSAAREGLKRALARGTRAYCLDFTGEDEPLSPDVFWQSSVDWTGTKGDKAASLAWLGAWVDKHGCRSILTDGARGLAYGDPDHKPRWMPALPCPKAIDSTGAGDAFRAGMLHGLSRDWDLAETIAFASATGALACTRLGGAANAPAIQEIEDHVSAYPEIADKIKTGLAT